MSSIISERYGGVESDNGIDENFEAYGHDCFFFFIRFFCVFVLYYFVVNIVLFMTLSNI